MLAALALALSFAACSDSGSGATDLGETDLLADAAPGDTGSDADALAPDPGPSDAIDAGEVDGGERGCEECDDGLECTTQRCAPDGSCYPPELKFGWCVIEGKCWRIGESIADGCLRCVPGMNPVSWTVVVEGTPCDDGDPCTHTDQCDGIHCSGTSYACDDGRPCTLDICNGDGTCSVTGDPEAGYCWIDGECVPDGTPRPDAVCERCWSPTDAQGWSSAALWAPCACEAGCTEAGSCEEGICLTESTVCEPVLGSDELSCTDNSVCPYDPPEPAPPATVTEMDGITLLAGGGGVEAGPGSAIVLDDAGAPHVFVPIAAAGELRHLALVDGRWTAEVLPLEAGEIPAEPAAARAEDGTLHVVYRDAAVGRLRHAMLSAGGEGWILATVDEHGLSVGHDAAAAVDGQGALHVVYRDEDGPLLRYARWAEGIWSPPVLVDRVPVGGEPALAIGPAGGLHVSYYDAEAKALRYASSADGLHFTTGLVDPEGAAADGADAGRYSAVVLTEEPAGEAVELRVALIYSDDAAGDLKASWKQGAGEWQHLTLHETKDAGDVGDFVVAAADGAGVIHVLYHDAVNGRLRYGRYAGGEWSHRLLDGRFEAVGTHAALGVDAAGHVHATYYDQDAAAVRYVTQTEGSWTVSTIDGPPPPDEEPDPLDMPTIEELERDSGWYTRTVTSPFGDVVILQVDAFHKKLRATTNSAGRLETADAGPNGWGAGAVSDARGRVHVVASPPSYTELALSTNVAGEWRSQLLDSSDWYRVFRGAAPVVDAEGVRHVFYCRRPDGDATRYGLWYTSDASGTFAPPSPVPEATSTDADTCYDSVLAARDGAGVFHVILATNGYLGSWSLRYLRGGPGGWDEVPLPELEKPVNPAFSLDSSGGADLFVATSNDAGSRLLHLRRSEGGWSVETVIEGIAAAPLDESGRVAVARDPATGTLWGAFALGSRLRTFDDRSGRWRLKTVELAPADTAGFAFPAVAVDGLGHVHVAYRDRELLRARHAVFVPFTGCR